MIILINTHYCVPVPLKMLFTMWPLQLEQQIGKHRKWFATVQLTTDKVGFFTHFPPVLPQDRNKMFLNRARMYQKSWKSIHSIYFDIYGVLSIMCQTYTNIGTIFNAIFKIVSKYFDENKFENKWRRPTTNTVRFRTVWRIYRDVAKCCMWGSALGRGGSYCVGTGLSKQGL